MATPSPIQDWTLFSLKRVRLKCISAILWMEADHLPQDLELSSAGGEEGGMDSFLCSQVCHGPLNSCSKKSKSSVIDHKQLKVTPSSLVYVLCRMDNRQNAEYC